MTAAVCTGKCRSQSRSGTLRLRPQSTSRPTISAPSYRTTPSAIDLSFRRHDMRPLDLLGLRFEASLQAAVDPVEINIDHRRDEQRQQLRHAETADHGDAERLTQLRTGAGTDCNRQRAE